MPDLKQIIRVDPVNPDAEILKTAGKILDRDGLVIFPAACMYGVAAKAMSRRAVEKVFALKQRPKNKAILILIPGPDSILDFTPSIPKAAEKLMDAFWPGKVTLVFDARKDLPDVLTAGTGKIGIRQPGHPVARKLIQAAGFALTGTSANLSGQKNCTTAAQLPREIIAHADLILDAGRLNGGSGSTIVDVTTDPVTILREGQVTAAQVWEALR